ncbi:MAG TPA: recombinase family protein [Candidatus Saccharimonadales bacterium]|nr:recombinase family protein [Candidatus Saccharimonadales bacterium]
MGRRWISYSRVSDDRSGRGRSVEEQDAENHRTAERLGDEIVASLVDNSIGASRYSKGKRVEWQHALKMLERREADGVMTWEASRATRDLDVYVQLRKVCREAGALWCYNGTVYNLNDGEDSFRTGLDILLAENEVDKTRKRVMRSTQANAERGLPHGKLLTGYKRVYSGNGVFVEQVKDPAWQPLIEEAFRRKLAGELDAHIVRDFQRRGLKTLRGADWSMSQIKRLLMNPGYAGLRVHRGNIIGPAAWAEHAYITEAEHYQIVAGYNARTAAKRHDGSIKYLLSGAARCGVCGGPVRVGSPRGYKSYHCDTGFHVSRKVNALDDLITELVLARLERPDILAALAVDNEPALQAIDRLSGLRMRLDGFYQAAAAGDLTPQALASIEKNLLPQIEQAEAEARPKNVPSVVTDLVASPRTIWPQLTIVQKRQVIALLMTVYIDRTRRGERVFNPDSIRISWKVG